ncbi:uncharacterized protein E0L32_002673 [Thyridium curvatum]|uniref:AMMECR1 domain-containing protein n=1 Tax=Thyridium curvatum TaxID=1093900 RepID=A0A507BHA4_9PEZI|nr:uncharacterized protein E0L32_002673 [Thyridium curvatum]TPX18164.1 hypothetical protein E0L32_002673 [Thyridium curvatum]
MATPAHCLYCFEVLAAELQDREPLSLKEVQKSFLEYAKATAGSSGPDGLAKRLPALRRLADASTGSSSTSTSTTSLSTGAQQSSSDGGDGSGGADTPMTSLSSLPGEDDDDDEEDEEEEEDESPLFVTWNTVSPRHGHSLRGCIGTFEPQPLEEGLSSYALTSALQDVRFDPVAARELPSLEVAVTLLTDFEDAASADDWELGTHGIRISFSHHGRRYGATYLPDVAVEQGWTKEETLVSLMRKAGWMGKKDRWRDVELSVVRYQGKKESLEYADYKKWREWVDKTNKKA